MDTSPARQIPGLLDIAPYLVILAYLSLHHLDSNSMQHEKSQFSKDF